MRIGVLGAARITPAALMKPAGVVDGVKVGAIAARDPQRARAFAARHGGPAVHDSQLGAIARVETAVCFPLPRFSDIRYDYALAGGALMDVGCYAVHALRLLGSGDPEVTYTAAGLPLRP